MTHLEYVKRFIAKPLDQLAPLAIYNAGQVVTMVVDRDGPFQAELVVLKPGGGFPYEHRHPNVNSFEVHFCGFTPLTINQRPAHMRAIRRPTDPDGAPLFLVRVKATDWHGAELSREGGSFFSVQEWFDAAPTSVLLNWEGQPISTEHRELLNG